MPDIRSFFGPKNGATPAKPAPKKDDDSKKTRSSEQTLPDSHSSERLLTYCGLEGRKVIDDSEDEEPVE